MCVIIVKDKEGKLPSKNSLENCFDRNSDGAGFMYVNDKGRLIIDKGYMNFNKFYKKYQKLCKKYNNFEGKNLVMHMRISTAGGVNKSNTHPFEITDSITKMKRLYNNCEIGMAHNGIISIASPTKVQEDLGINDTMIYIKEYINKIYRSWKNCFKNSAFLKGIELMTHSKFAILDKKDNLYMVGDFVKFEGTYYSNTSYEKYNYYNYKNYHYYYDDFYDEYEYENSKNKSGKDEDIIIYDEDNTGNDEFSVYDDNDYVLLPNQDEFMQLGEIRTEDHSIFLYNENEYYLEEVDTKGNLIKSYYDTVVIRYEDFENYISEKTSEELEYEQMKVQ